MKKSLLWLIVIFILLTTYSPNFNFDSNLKFNIKKIEINNNYIIKEEEIEKSLNFLYEKNLFSLDIAQIKNNLLKEEFVASFRIKKIYPDTLKIIIVEKKPIAILFKKKKKFYITEEGDLINFKDIKIYENLSTVFGGAEEFSSLYTNLKYIEFPLKKIKSYYFFESGRWDLILHDETMIKLPVKDYQLSLKNFMKSLSDNNFKNYKIFDYRIKDQLILN